jgi:Protein of unknown function (DUF3313)
MMMKRLLPALAVLALVACAKTEQQSGSSMAPNSGFLGDYSNLKTGEEGQAALRYVNPNVDWSKYKAIYLEPVQFWAQPDSSVKPEDQQQLTNYYYNTLKQHLSAQLPIIEQPGPNTILLRVALTDASTATPGLRTVSVVVPQARLLSGITNLASGSYAFVGSAQSEMEALDTQTHQELAAAVDRRSGGLAISNAGVWQWGDAEHIMDYWAELVTKRLGEVRSGQAITMR